MIQTKYFIFAILLSSTLSLSAIDINNTVEIIEEASKATEKLQEDFSQLIETKEPIQQEILSTTTERNVTAQELIIVEDNIENISIEEHNETMQELTMTDNKLKESTNMITVETNETLPKTVELISQTSIINDTSIVENNPSTTENNLTILIEANSTLEENQTIEQNSTIEEEDGSFTKGMVIFKTKLKAVCKMTGEEFAKNYTQEDWDDIYDNDEFEKIVYELCPAMKDKYDKKWTNDLYQFSLKYASDSDEIPEC